MTSSSSVATRDSSSRWLGSPLAAPSVQDELRVGHVITKALFLQTLELLVLAGGLTAPFLRNNISQRSILLSLLHCFLSF